MAYNELIKNFKSIRDYMRQFYVYGFKSRSEYDAKSARSYDDVRRRIDSWLGEYMSFHQSSSGKAQFLSVDSGSLAHNPLYQAFKTKSFTDNDIILHFFLLDMLHGDTWYSFRECVDKLYTDYLNKVDTEVYLDESTVRNKLKEYVSLGLIVQKKEGKSYLYRCSRDQIDSESWQEAVAFFSEIAPLGVIGSYLQDKSAFVADDNLFRFKHHYILHALDSQILLQLFEAMHAHTRLHLNMKGRKQTKASLHIVLPIKIYISAQTGREYLLAYVYGKERMSFFRLDNISDVKLGKKETDWMKYVEQYDKLKNRIWGVALGNKRTIDHVEMVIHVEDDEQFIVNRLAREKRNGMVKKIDAHTYCYVTDTHEAKEMLPWVRTFIGRIERFHCSDVTVEKMFWDDLSEMKRMYLGGDEDAV